MATTATQGPTIRVAPLTPAERGAINILSTEERKVALLDAARRKALTLFPVAPEREEVAS